MPVRFFVALAVFLSLALLCFSLEAQAARFGGGRSFGGSPSFSRPMPSSQMPSGSMRNPSAMQQQPAAAAAARPGGFGMGGMLGGLLAGTLIGSLLAGEGFSGGGMFDILLIGLGLYLLFKFLGRRREAASGRTDTGLNMPVPDQPGAGRSGLWDALGGSSGASGNKGRANAPAGFDREDFLRGAKMLYQRMNDSWDKRDLDDIEAFSTRPFMAEIRRQAEESPAPEKTDILLVNADLISVITEAGRETASVYFDVALREGSRGEPSQVREVWHFVRAADSKENWKLDGIQQVED